MTARSTPVTDGRARAIRDEARAHRRMSNDFKKQGKGQLAIVFRGIAVGFELAARVRYQPWLNPWWL